MGIEEHGAVAAIRAELGVAPFLRADGGAVQGRAVLAPDAKRRLIPRGRGIVQQRHEAAAFVAGGEGEVAEVGYRRVEVHRLHDARAGGAVALGPGDVQDQRHARAVFEEGAGL